MAQPDVLSQAFELGFTYTRSTGPVVGRFLTGLRDRRIYGIRASDGRVIVPPMEYDPKTAAALDEFVEVGQQGTIRSWCWVKWPRSTHPLQQPFAWAMIQLDGADVPMIHCVAAAAEEEKKKETPPEEESAESGVKTVPGGCSRSRRAGSGKGVPSP